MTFESPSMLQQRISRLLLLFHTLPEWNETAKLEGKFARLQQFVDHRGEQLGSAELLATLQEIEQAVRHMHLEDPLTILLTEVRQWREAVAAGGAVRTGHKAA